MMGFFCGLALGALIGLICLCGYSLARDAEPRIGEWMYEYTGKELDGTDAPLNYKCTLCGGLAVDPWDYCPNCGARMTEEAERCAKP